MWPSSPLVCHGYDLNHYSYRILHVGYLSGLFYYLCGFDLLLSPKSPGECLFWDDSSSGISSSGAQKSTAKDKTEVLTQAETSSEKDSFFPAKGKGGGQTLPDSEFYETGRSLRQ